mmetsp:Transcript_26110/g.65814  ORF Transcript_26110/g.65814 Transcript_26110/m.65814 type:complete len:206 (+) Transcript_26110:530-1147(+)
MAVPENALLCLCRRRRETSSKTCCWGRKRCRKHLLMGFRVAKGSVRAPRALRAVRLRLRTRGKALAVLASRRRPPPLLLQNLNYLVRGRCRLRPQHHRNRIPTLLPEAESTATPPQRPPPYRRRNPSPTRWTSTRSPRRCWRSTLSGWSCLPAAAPTTSNARYRGCWKRAGLLSPDRVRRPRCRESPRPNLSRRDHSTAPTTFRL